MAATYNPLLHMRKRSTEPAKPARTLWSCSRSIPPDTCKEMAALLDREMHKTSGRITELKELGQVTTTDIVRDGGAVVALISATPVPLSADELAESLLEESEEESEEHSCRVTANG
jgi:hypothetical protein